VVAAARELFLSSGYEGATVRQIATLAGTAVGSVFTTFASKGEILSQVMQERLESLYAALDSLAPELQGSTLERLRAMFAFHIAFETAHVRLFLAHISATFDWTLSPTATPFGKNQRLRGAVEACLRKGVAEGDVDAAADLGAVVELIVAAYGWTYRLAAWEQADAAAMTAEMDRHLGLIACGFAPR